MKMKLHRVGAMRGATRQNEVLLLGEVDDIRTLRAFEGMEVEVEIRPHLLFQIGDRVHYSRVIGEPPTVMNCTILDGPRVVGSTVCWKISDVIGVVAQAALVAA